MITCYRFINLLLENARAEVSRAVEVLTTNGDVIISIHRECRLEVCTALKEKEMTTKDCSNLLSITPTIASITGSPKEMSDRKDEVTRGLVPLGHFDLVLLGMVNGRGLRNDTAIRAHG